MGAGFAPSLSPTYEPQIPIKPVGMTGFMVSFSVESCELPPYPIALTPGEAPLYLALAWVRSCALAPVSVAAGAGGEVRWSLCSERAS